MEWNVGPVLLKFLWPKDHNCTDLRLKWVGGEGVAELPF